MNPLVPAVSHPGYAEREYDAPVLLTWIHPDSEIERFAVCAGCSRRWTLGTVDLRGAELLSKLYAVTHADCDVSIADAVRCEECGRIVLERDPHHDRTRRVPRRMPGVHPVTIYDPEVDLWTGGGAARRVAAANGADFIKKHLTEYYAGGDLVELVANALVDLRAAGVDVWTAARLAQHRMDQINLEVCVPVAADQDDTVKKEQSL